MKPYWSDGQCSLFVGDCRHVLPSMEADSADAVVCDPPYDLTAGKRGGTGAASLNPDSPAGRSRISTGGFMGASWDATGVAFDPETWRAVMRVMRPGAFLLAFGGTRTWHRLTCAIEDAGFEIRDSLADLTGLDAPALMWVYAGGFPKSLDVAKAIDGEAGAERAVVATGTPLRRMIPGATQNRTGSWIKDDGREFVPAVTEPATPEAAAWQGWGTALRPSWEPIVVGRKPLAGTVAQNVLAHGTGALNIGACRIEGGLRPARTNEASASGLTGTGGAATYGSFAVRGSIAIGETAEGRWPPNVLLGAEAAAELDRQSGVLTSGRLEPHHDAKPSANGSMSGGNYAGRIHGSFGGDTGGASRFFPVFRYEAKASASERPRLGDGTAHPTVKPLDLMSWLVRLVTPPGGTVLDPFAGSGTTGQACVIEGFRCVLIEKDERYAELIRARLDKPIQQAMFGEAL